MRVSENMVVRRTMRSKTDKVTGNWKNLHKEEFHNLCFSPNIIKFIRQKTMRWTGHVAHMWEMTRIKMLQGNPEEKRLL
jgi:hypothetical protein